MKKYLTALFLALTADCLALAPEAVLAALLPRYLEARLFGAMLEGAASEHASRQRAMKAATDNAEELRIKLTRQMNRARQDAITTEIMEIVGGAEALRAGAGGDDVALVDLLPIAAGGPAPMATATAGSAVATATALSADQLKAASSLFGKRVVFDSLQLVEGIGKKIEELCHAIGIKTWQQLADTPVAVLHDMLTAAGSSYQMADPTTWPQQAALAASADFAALKKLQDDLTGGRAE